LLVLLAFVHTGTADQSADFIKACYDNWAENVDYFVENAIPIDSAGYTITYHNYYKLLTNTFTNETYSLYCSKTVPPGSVVPSSTIRSYIQIPVTSIAIQHAIPSIDFLEILGSLNLVKAISPLNNVTSPCALAEIQSNAIAPFNQSFYDTTSVTFTAEPVPNSQLKSVVTVSLPDSLTPLAKANWIHFFAAFTNQENISIEIYNAIQTEYNCHRGNFLNATDRHQIAWISYDSIAKTWNLMNDTFRTSLISDVGGAFPMANQTSFTSFETFDSAISNVWMAIDETPFGATNNTFADWLTLSGFVPGASAGNSTFITTHKVFRTDRSQNHNGYSSWLERSPSRPDLVLRDLIAVQYPTYDKAYQEIFLENWSTGDSLNYSDPNTCNLTYYPIQSGSIGNCVGNVYTLPTPIVPSTPISKSNSPNQALSAQEKFGVAFGVVGGAVIVAVSSIFVVRFLKQRKIGFGEETAGFMRISDLD